MKDYLRNGAVSKSEIANDIKNGTLGRQDIEKLVKRESVSSAFIGTTYPKKVGQEQWTEKYLEKLVLAAVAESFNEDYLYYLYDVAKYVRVNAKKKKGLLSGIAIVAGIVVIVVVIVLIVTAIRK